MLGGIVTLVFFILRIIPSTADAANVIVWFLRPFPSFCFGSGVINLGSRKLFA
jgi:ATP-binding cassette subfamily A (ABC1) protein 3